MVDSRPLLPSLSEHPNHHPDSCLSLSTTLLAYLSSLFRSTTYSQPPHHADTVLSIGSGTGLLEALLSQYLASTHIKGNPEIKIKGVEVYAEPPVNKYLPDELVSAVHGTWDFCHRAGEEDVKVWLFVYPRKVDLVGGYVERFVCKDVRIEKEEAEGGTAAEGVQMVIWAGPRRDVEDYEGVFEKLEGMGWVRDVKIGESVGVKEWEGVVALRRKARI